MAQWSASNIRVSGIASAVPEHTRGVEDVASQFGQEAAEKITASVGVQTRHIASARTCTSDLCCAAAQRILDEVEWDPDSIDALIFVTQTPDYILPATACSLHRRLKLGTHCLAFDVNLGCSGYVYGLALASRLLGAGNVRRALVLVGDTASKIVSPEDRSAAPLFGDAGTATAIEYSEGAPEMSFDLGTDGSGEEHLIIPSGSFRQPATSESCLRTERENGNIRSDQDLFMDGGEVFAFTLAQVPGLIKRTLQGAGWTVDDIDGVVLHQANAFMLNHLRKRLKIDDQKMILALDDYGNTSSASIPLAMTATWSQTPPAKPLQLVLGGFGVGWSWAGAALTCENVALPELIIVPDKTEDGTASPATQAA